MPKRAPATSRVQRTDPALVRRAVDLSIALMDGVLQNIMAGSPDPRLSFPRFRILARLDSAPSRSVGELARTFRIGRSTASELVARMVADGMVEKVADKSDGRSVHLALSSAGRRLMLRRQKEIWSSFRLSLDRMSPRRREAFVDALAVLNDTVGRRHM
jgi:DNA-binding MarR family transcriptional regulator